MFVQFLSPQSLICACFEDKTTPQLGVVVVDELHMMGDASRGYILEVLLTKIKFLASSVPVASSDPVTSSNPVQVIGMSATLSNPQDICKCLEASLFVTSARPVPLQQRVLLDGRILDSQGLSVRQLPDLKHVLPPPLSDPEHVAQLCAETLEAGGSVLVFCPARGRCEALAASLAKLLPIILERGPFQLAHARAAELKPSRLALVGKLQTTLFGLDEKLRACVPQGTAFHHAGLANDERELVERAFRSGVLSVLCATSTLAAGVNLPARRVLFRSLKMGTADLDASHYRQMSGRAGRAGFDTCGESILLLSHKKELKFALDLINAPLPSLASVLSGGVKPAHDDASNDTVAMRRILLEAVASGLVSCANTNEPNATPLRPTAKFSA